MAADNHTPSSRRSPLAASTQSADETKIQRPNETMALTQPGSNRKRFEWPGNQVWLSVTLTSGASRMPATTDQSERVHQPIANISSRPASCEINSMSVTLRMSRSRFAVMALVDVKPVIAEANEVLAMIHGSTATP